MKNIYRAGVLILMALSLAGFASAAPSVTLLYSFGLNPSKGKGHVSDLIVGQHGGLYGTTYEGGANGYGTVFKLTPPASPGGAWTEKVLYSFCSQQPQCFDGSYPTGGLVAYQGALYGTTTYGGNDCGYSGCGTIFKLLPPVSPGAGWTYAVVYYFKTSGDGTNPSAGLIVDQQGVLYGTTNGGGLYGNGTVFKLPQDTGHGWNETVLYSFAGGNDGADPLAGLVAYQGSLYGTTYKGGSNGYGTVFKLKPPASPGAAWKETVLHSFTGGNDGAYPMGGLLADVKGGLYGTTTYGGANCQGINWGSCGTVFKEVPPDSSIPRWTLSTLHSFSPTGRDGNNARGHLTFGKDGALYGTTEYGGFNAGGPEGNHQCGFLYSCGTIFKLTGSDVDWIETVIYKFCAGKFCTTGAYPTAGLVAYGGALYGTTSYQGSGAACNCGTVFKLDY